MHTLLRCAARNQSDFDKIIQTKRAEACIAEDQGALRERQWMESAQAVYPNPQACASIDCDCSGKRRARPGSPERAPLANRQDGNKPKNNKVWNVKVCKRATCPANPK